MTLAKVFLRYKAPADAATFDRYYRDVHVPIAKRIPGLRAYEVTRGDIGNFATGGVEIMFAESGAI
jgi:uncharacterized protein (TIGR02118 family)